MFDHRRPARRNQICDCKQSSGRSQPALRPEIVVEHAYPAGDPAPVRLGLAPRYFERQLEELDGLKARDRIDRAPCDLLRQRLLEVATSAVSAPPPFPGDGR